MQADFIFRVASLLLKNRQLLFQLLYPKPDHPGKERASHSSLSVIKNRALCDLCQLEQVTRLITLCEVKWHLSDDWPELEVTCQSSSLSHGHVCLLLIASGWSETRATMIVESTNQKSHGSYARVIGGLEHREAAIQSDSGEEIVVVPWFSLPASHFLTFATCPNKMLFSRNVHMWSAGSLYMVPLDVLLHWDPLNKVEQSAFPLHQHK